MTCANCIYFLANDFNAMMGLCRRYPVNANKHANDWCGELKIVNKLADKVVDQIVEKRGNKRVSKANNN